MKYLAVIAFSVYMATKGIIIKEKIDNKDWSMVVIHIISSMLWAWAIVLYWDI